MKTLYAFLAEKGIDRDIAMRVESCYFSKSRKDAIDLGSNLQIEYIKNEAEKSNAILTFFPLDVLFDTFEKSWLDEFFKVALSEMIDEVNYR